MGNGVQLFRSPISRPLWTSRSGWLDVEPGRLALPRLAGYCWATPPVFGARYHVHDRRCVPPSQALAAVKQAIPTSTEADLLLLHVFGVMLVNLFHFCLFH